MAYTFEQLSKMNVGDLRRIAEGVEHDAVKGFTTMHKEKLLPALCSALGIEAHIHHESKGVDKTKLKMEIRALKRDREAALQAHDSARLKEIRTKVKHLKRILRKAMV